jgi:hypothetical protein
VLRDIDDKIVNTGGVAVRPFWWGNEYLEALGLKTYALGPGGTAEDNSGSEDTAADGIETDAAGGLLDQATGSPLSTFLIVTVALLSLFLVAAAVYLIKLSTRKKMISIPTVASTFQQNQSAPPQHYHSDTSSTYPLYCVNCGKPLTAGSNFCPGCGKEIATH